MHDYRSDETNPIVEFVNLTPHPITLTVPREERGMGEPFEATVTIPPGGKPPRVKEHSTIGYGVSIADPDYPGWYIRARVEEWRGGLVLDLPEPRDGVIYIVARMVAEAAPERGDLVFPARQVRDSQGRIVGCLALGYAARQQQR